MGGAQPICFFCARCLAMLWAYLKGLILISPLEEMGSRYHTLSTALGIRSQDRLLSYFDYQFRSSALDVTSTSTWRASTPSGRNALQVGPSAFETPWRKVMRCRFFGGGGGLAGRNGAGVGKRPEGQFEQRSVALDATGIHQNAGSRDATPAGQP